MRAELANLSDCAVPFLSRATVNFSWYDSTMNSANVHVRIQLMYMYEDPRNMNSYYKIRVSDKANSR